MTTKKRTTTPRTPKYQEGLPRVPWDPRYTPETWTLAQLAFHRAGSLDAALKQATCLAGGWYARPVTIDYRTDDTNAETGEAYMLRPSEVAAEPGWMPCYEVRKVTAS